MRFAPEQREEEALFAEQLARGARLAAIVRLSVIAAIALWLPARVGTAVLLHYLAPLTVLALSGLVQALAARDERLRARLLQALLVAIDMGVLTWAIVVPPPDAGPEWPAPMQLRLGSFPFFFVFLAFAALGYSPFLTLWAAVSGAIAWSAGHLWILAQPGAFTVTDLGRLHGLGVGEIVRLLLDPGYVSMVVWAQDVLLLLSVGAILAVAVSRARDLVARAAVAAAQRARLARHFSPNVVRELARRGGSEPGPRLQRVAVLFVDLRGFTGFAARATPQEVIALLQEFHALVAEAVFTRDGTLDKYLGDGVMITFGTPQPKPDDAARAVDCVLALIRGARTWAEARRASGREAVRLAIGAQCGEVLVGEFGDARRLEFAVLGDAVNVASRLQELARDRQAVAALGQELVRAAGTPLPEGLPGLVAEHLPAAVLRGRAIPLDVWLLREGEGTRG